MKVIDAKFTRRFVTGEYEFEEYTLTAQVNDGETGSQVLTELKGEVAAAFVGEATVVPEEKKETKQPAKKQKTKKEEKKNVKPKADHVDDEDADDEDSASEDAGDDGESDQDDETTDHEDGDDGDDSSDSDEDSDDSEGDDEEESKPAPKKAGTKKASPAKGGGKTEEGKKSFRKKPQTYNRSIEQHKEIFSGLIRSVAPDWKKTEASKAKAKKTSESMVGKEFLDENGEVLESFRSEVKKMMLAKK